MPLVQHTCRLGPPPPPPSPPPAVGSTCIDSCNARPSTPAMTPPCHRTHPLVRAHPDSPHTAPPPALSLAPKHGQGDAGTQGRDAECQLLTRSTECSASTACRHINPARGRRQGTQPQTPGRDATRAEYHTCMRPSNVCARTTSCEPAPQVVLRPATATHPHQRPGRPRTLARLALHSAHADAWKSRSSDHTGSGRGLTLTRRGALRRTDPVSA
jgi:hypothetical protein